MATHELVEALINYNNQLIGWLDAIIKREEKLAADQKAKEESKPGATGDTSSKAESLSRGIEPPVGTTPPGPPVELPDLKNLIGIMRGGSDSFQNNLKNSQVG